MDRNVQVFRTEASMKEALGVLESLKERYASVVVQDKGRRYNTDLLEAVELGFLIELAEVITLGALARKESRGGHFREDYEARDDVNFMRHTMAYRAPVTDVDNGARSRTRSASTTAGDRDPLPADGAQVLMTATVEEKSEAKGRRDPDLHGHAAHRALQPRVRHSAPHFEDYQVTALATDRVLDALHQIKWDQDGSLSFRAPARTACAAATPCASTARTGWPARP